MHAYMHTCIHAYMHTCIHAYMHTCIHAYMHTCIHAYMHACIHTCMHAYIHTYIHTCIRTQVGQEIRRASRSNHEKDWTDKVTHGYNRKIVKEDPKVNQSLSVKWIHNSTLTSHMEAYMFAIEKQEIVTNATKKRREPDITKRRTTDRKCRVCGKQEETLTHILGSCESISESLYLKYRHNQVGQIVYQEFLENNGVKNQAPA